MFAPTKTWRKWHRKVNITQKRYAVASALAASAVPALAMARGHRIDEVPEIPLVVDDAIESITKTSAAKEVLACIGAFEDVDKASESKKIRAGKGKMRNRRYTLRRGPLIIYSKDDGVEQAFRNLPGVDLCCVERLNLLQLAPGGHMGRFCIWSQSAIDSLDTIYHDGNDNKQTKGRKLLPRAAMHNADIARIINSDEVQSVVNPAKPNRAVYLKKRNPLKSMDALEKLNPYAAAARKAELHSSLQRAHKKSEMLAKSRAAQKEKKKYKAQGKAFYDKVSQQGLVCDNGFEI